MKCFFRYETRVFLKNSGFSYLYGSISYLFGYEKNRCFSLMLCLVLSSNTNIAPPCICNRDLSTATVRLPSGRSGTVRLMRCLVSPALSVTGAATCAPTAGAPELRSGQPAATSCSKHTDRSVNDSRGHVRQHPVARHAHQLLDPWFDW